MIQHWRCPRCKRRGSVRFVKDADVWVVVAAIRESHATRSAQCYADVRDIRCTAKPRRA